MASDAVPSPSHAAPTEASVLPTLTGALYTILASLASLKIAVTLFAMGIFIILVGTLAQTRMDMWEVIDHYFLSWVAWIELQTFFPHAWAPNYQNIGGGFLFPGGAAIGAGLAINLTAAHLTRFSIQARGRRLWLGLGAMAAAAVFTAVVIASGHNRFGFQAEPWLEWSSLWLVLRFGIAALAVAALLGSILLPLSSASRWTEQKLLFGLAVFLCPLAVYLFAAGENAYLGDSGMRILWQLIQATMAGIAILLASRVLYKKRGAVVTIHLGIALLMFGQFWVAKHDVEEQILLGEGETASFARDVRQTELAIVDRSQPNQDEVIAIPQSLLLASKAVDNPSLLGRLAPRDSRLDEHGVIRVDELPFDIQVLEYHKNSRLVDVDKVDSNLATAGTGLGMVAVPVQASTGADSDAGVDLAAAYVKLSKQGADLGVYMLSQIASSQDVVEQLTIDGKNFELSLRFRRNYKPYSITLLDVRKDDYLGTAIPRNYSSDIRLVDNDKRIDREIHIWMNNPLRFAGETFYQSSYSGPPQAPTESSTISVVTNSGWMIPYVACMVVVVGLVGHFWGSLARFLDRRRREAELPAQAAHQPAKSQGSRAATLAIPLIAVALCCLLFGYVARPHAEEENQFKIHQFGRLPVIADGRVKPFDTLARNNLRVISNRYSFRARLPEDELQEQWPQISEKLQSRWHQLTPDELEEQKGDVGAVIALIVEKTGANEEDRYRIEEYVDKLTTERQPAIRWLLDVITDPEVAEQHKVVRIDNLEVLDTLGLARRKGHLFSIEEIRGGLTEFERQLAQARELEIRQLSVYQRKLLELDQRIRTYTRIAAAFRPPNLPPLPTAEEFENDRSAAVAKLTTFREAYSSFTRSIDSIKPPLAVPIEDPDGEDSWKSYASAWASALIDVQVLGKPLAPAMTHLHTALLAYQEGDVAKFNATVEMYEQHLQREPPQQLKGSSTISGRLVQQQFDSFYAFEAYFNKVSPFFVCWWPYLAAFVLACLAWLGWNRPLNRTAFWLIAITFCVHTAALIARVYLSGRPPVTNLYSSAVFIGWTVVAFGLVLEAIYRNGVGNVVGAALGFASLVIAHNLAGDGDTMAVLQAVLDTQFWLALHVVTVTLGYGATFLAGALGVAYITRGLLSTSLGGRERKELTRMIYGVLCFALFFSFFGTILGGLWADDSWGRFWGWDPKENGALIIVLWNVLVLHCRWDGMVKDRGLAVLAVVGNIVTAWSWFGVNELGVGLHSYGFTEGVLRTLGIFVFSQLGVILLGILPTQWWLSHRNEAKAAA